MSLELEDQYNQRFFAPLRMTQGKVCDKIVHILCLCGQRFDTAVTDRRYSTQEMLPRLRHA
jgi:hypothetical protein